LAHETPRKNRPSLFEYQEICFVHPLPGESAAAAPQAVHRLFAEGSAVTVAKRLDGKSRLSQNFG
jgi:hypothetical protein